MKNLKSFLEKDCKIFEFIGFLPEGQACYLVGGAVRDALRGRAIHDYDFASPGDPTSLARAWARQCKGHWFWLDKPRRQSRVVLGRGAQEPTFDFSPFRAADLEGDLRGRDFTVNALAIDMTATDAPELIDPLGGAQDLAQGRLRACAATSFADDPLRVVRAARFAAVHDLYPDRETCSLAQAASSQLVKVAGERIKAELFILFGSAQLLKGLEVLADCAGLTNIFGAATEREQSVAIEETTEFCERLSALDGMQDCLADGVEAGLTRAGLLRLGAFLRAYPIALGLIGLGQRLALARVTTNRLQALALLRPSQISPLPGNNNPSQRQLALWAARLGRDPLDALVFLACQVDATAQLKKLIPHVARAWQSLNLDGRVPPLLGGDWVRRELHVSNGRTVGKLLDALTEAELNGSVTSPESAQEFLKSLSQKED
ncbi:poly(A) polymerase [Geoalkalibacter ferrihydriticus]|nr:CCA tRNA nucleotidyltransferase [Geoalkalibacter ferrihydriticus]SDM18833.1 poly(A) polymerase [Geoalkalibacter ferrihydriticus]